MGEQETKMKNFKISDKFLKVEDVNLDSSFEDEIVDVRETKNILKFLPNDILTIILLMLNFSDYYTLKLVDENLFTKRFSLFSFFDKSMTTFDKINFKIGQLGLRNK